MSRIAYTIDIDSTSKVIAGEVERLILHRLSGLGLANALMDAEAIVLKAAVVLAIEGATRNAAALPH
ncbi:hypothetical protein [Paraburkholderia sacchari]|uniref:Uncharacterized protein n=1 Tax=Paraburkholderia sacchari TaxID=159450 RepID=A0A8T6ZKU6_9BURK|nr:hypothetical protein [Paraburkholderia sacchari]NLP64299.1 hypothetical protein [Paraburkholderia sacchari]